MPENIYSDVKIVSVAQMVAIEKEAVAQGLSYKDMILNAGKGLAEKIINAHIHGVDKTILGLIGKGNNGSDTLAALTILQSDGWETVSYVVGGRPQEDDLIKRYIEAGGKTLAETSDKTKRKLKSAINRSRYLVDGLLGTGISLPLRSPVANVLKISKEVIENSDSPPMVVAVDCPSGMDCDSGEVAEQILRADITVCMAAVKTGMLKLPANSYIGNLKVAGIGLSKKVKPWTNITRFVVTQESVKNILPERKIDGHKGTFGTAIIIGGSQNYTGAARFAGQAAHRTGAGMISMCVPEQVYITQAGHFPESIWTILPDREGGIASSAVEIAKNVIREADAVLIGPGLGLDAETQNFINKLVLGKSENKVGAGLIGPKKNIEKSQNKSLPPLVVDADGLKLLSRIDNWWEALAPNTILTPHPGEMSILTGVSTEEIQSDRPEVALEYAKKWGHVVVLKGAFSIVAVPDGQVHILPFANPVLAHAGTGDVLAGLITGLLAQGVLPEQAATLGLWLHAESAKIMIDKIGTERAVLAGDLISAIGKVLGELESKKAVK